MAGSMAVAIGPEASTLDAVKTSDCVLAVWQRPADSALSALLADLDPDNLDDIEARLAVPAAAPEIDALLAAAGYPSVVAAVLGKDIASLAALHGAAASTSPATVKVRLDWINTDSCRRFHADMVTTRMLTTYFGRGTQWKEAQQDDPEARELQTGEVAIFKGRRLAPDAPILHRSPPIAGTGDRRLLLVIDLATGA